MKIFSAVLELLYATERQTDMTKLTGAFWRISVANEPERTPARKKTLPMALFYMPSSKDHATLNCQTIAWLAEV
jgi:hypothetical protein